MKVVEHNSATRPERQITTLLLLLQAPGEAIAVMPSSLREEEFARYSYPQDAGSD